jgi:hypothetical protein
VTPPRVVVVVPARDRHGVEAKVSELEALHVDYLIVCGESMPGDHILFRPRAGKYDALNAGIAQVLPGADVIVLNDVDTHLPDLSGPIEALSRSGADMVFCRVAVESGPQQRFYRLLDLLRDYLPIAASGELVIVRASALERLLPMPPTLAEDTWLLFKFRELRRKVVFWTATAVTTRRTETLAEEVAYKQRTVCGIYQALTITRPGALVTLFYGILPFIAPALLLTGPGGRAWWSGIWRGVRDYLRGTQSGSFDRIGGPGTTKVGP